MAYQENKPAKNNNWLIGLIILIILALLAFYFFRGKGNTEVVAEAASDSSTIESKINANWSGVDPLNSLPAENYEEIRDSDITVRGSAEYAIYGLGESVLFDSGKSQIKPGAESKLEKVVKSAEQRYPNSDIRIYGYTDASGDQASNKKLAEERAEAVKAWMLQNGKVKAEHISINPVGEQDPAASNASSEGREKNRRVEIAIRKK
jgi:outer membrane protein OmpA-like peptidoglycan-associated protein